MTNDDIEDLRDRLHDIEIRQSEMESATLKKNVSLRFFAGIWIGFLIGGFGATFFMVALI